MSELDYTISLEATGNARELRLRTSFGLALGLSPVSYFSSGTSEWWDLLSACCSRSMVKEDQRPKCTGCGTWQPWDRDTPFLRYRIATQTSHFTRANFQDALSRWVEPWFLDWENHLVCGELSRVLFLLSDQWQRTAILSTVEEKLCFFSEELEPALLRFNSRHSQNGLLVNSSLGLERAIPADGGIL